MEPVEFRHGARRVVLGFSTPDRVTDRGRLWPESRGNPQRHELLAHQMDGTASIHFACVMRDLTGSYTVPFAVADLRLLPATLAAFAIREQQYSALPPR